MKCRLGLLLLDIDEWLIRRHILIPSFGKGNEDHVNFLCRWGFGLIFNNKK